MCFTIAKGICLQPLSHVLKKRELDADNKPQREKKMKIHMLIRQLYSSKLEQDSFSDTNS